MIVTSWINATIAPIAILGSNRNAMYALIAARTTANPINAFREISPPHVGPTSSMFTSTGSMPACRARSRRIVSELVTPSLVNDGARTEMLSPFTIWTSASSIPWSARSEETSSTLTASANR